MANEHEAALLAWSTRVLDAWLTMSKQNSASTPRLHPQLSQWRIVVKNGNERSFVRGRTANESRLQLAQLLWWRLSAELRLSVGAMPEAADE